MKIFIAGIDGYLGWPLALHLAARGHEIVGADVFFRRKWVDEVGGQSAIPIYPMSERLEAYQDRFRRELRFWEGDLRNYNFSSTILKEFRPEAIVHLGECPSAPYSMIDIHHANFVQTNNISTTLNLLFGMCDLCPTVHLIKLGTMGEYGTPNIDIPEGFFEIDFRGRHDRLPFPRQAGSWYHWSKVHDSFNVMFACKMWGLLATDVMQGVVFGTRINEMSGDDRLSTRFDFDQVFGTVVNRYCAQAVVGHPLTPFGRGYQRRGFLPLRDSMQCLTLSIEHPPAAGEYRVVNQFEEVYDITELATKVQRVARDLGLDAQIHNLENPRKELEEHYYRPDHSTLLDLGYRPTHDVETEIKIMISDLIKYRSRIESKRDLFIPDVRWVGHHSKVKYLDESIGPSAKS